MFVISWRNPDGTPGTGICNRYGEAILDADAIAREITKAPKLNPDGAGAGGIITSMVRHLSAIGQLDPAGPAWSLGVTLLDMTEAGRPVSLWTRAGRGSILASRVRGYMDGKTLAEVFAWLRPNDLIWTYWVNDYLEGKSRRPSTSCTGTPTPPGCLPRCTVTSSRSPWPTR